MLSCTHGTEANAEERIGSSEAHAEGDDCSSEETRNEETDYSNGESAEVQEHCASKEPQAGDDEEVASDSSSIRIWKQRSSGKNSADSHFSPGLVW